MKVPQHNKELLIILVKKKINELMKTLIYIHIQKNQHQHRSGKIVSVYYFELAKQPQIVKQPRWLLAINCQCIFKAAKLSERLNPSSLIEHR